MTSVGALTTATTAVDIIPNEYTCPISYELMADPVILEDGHTYERSAIERWLETNSISPITRQSVSASSLKPNFALRTCIERWKELNSLSQKWSQQSSAAKSAEPSSRPIFSESSFLVQSTSTGGLLIRCTHTTPIKSAIIAVIDRSGSMSEPATSGTQNTEMKDSFRRIDLVKHSLNTLSRMLGPSTGFGIISFSNAAKVELPIRNMDGQGQRDAEKAINAIQPTGGTNIWDGLRIAFDMATKYGAANPDTDIHIVLLTDGEPTEYYTPIGGITAALGRKKVASPVRLTVHSFGVGYSLDVKLLESISIEGGGIYGYIPDCSMVGTIFINFAASILTTVASHVSVSGKRVGAFRSGEARYLLNENGVPALEREKIVIEGTLKGEVQEFEIPVQGLCSQEEAIKIQILGRLQKAVEGAIRNSAMQAALEEFEELAGWLEDFGTPFAVAARKDVESENPNEGQLLKAVEREDWYRRWGLNHLVSYSRALACQQCTNFKDAVLQEFAGTPFKEMQERGNAIFDDMPPPEITCAVERMSLGCGNIGSGPLLQPFPTLQSISMREFNNAAGPCWTGSTEIRVLDGSFKPAKEIVAGEVLWGGYKVVTVVKTVVGLEVPMVKVGQATITPWHPIRRRDPGEGWKFPADVNKQELQFINFYYNLVLDRGHIVQLLGGWDTCTLGHGFTSDSVIEHPYFGTDAVLEDLKKQAGWSEGLVVLKGGSFMRDAVTGLVCGLTVESAE